MTSLTPSALSSFLAGIGLWGLLWAAVWKVDSIIRSFGLPRFQARRRLLDWCSRNKAATLLTTEAINFGTHGVGDPLGVAFALGGTVTNFVVVMVLLPLRRTAVRFLSIRVR